MNKFKRMVAVCATVGMLWSTVYAQETRDLGYRVKMNEGQVTVTEDDFVSDIDNSNLDVSVVKQQGDTRTTIFTGKLKDYDNGRWVYTDFSEIRFMVVIEWEGPEDEAIYIIPVSSDKNQSGTEEDIITDKALENNKSVIYQSNVLNTFLDNAEINVSLLYDNAYSETVLTEGEELIAELTVKNSDTQNSINIMSIIALYNEQGKLIEMSMESKEIAANTTDTFPNKIVVPSEENAASAKIMIWDGLSAMRPISSPLIMTVTGSDYFGDDYSLAQPITGRNKANGKINTPDDTDVFSFIPQNDGLYYFETFSDIDTYATLYQEGQMNTPIAADDNSGADNNFRLSATLESNKKYYLYVKGRAVGNYSLNYGYSIGNIFGTITPIKFYDDDTEFNNLCEAIVTLQTYRTDDFVASVHLKDWSQSNNEYASYSMTGVHSGEYLAKTMRAGYLTKYQRINLSDNTVDMGSITLIPGDVNGDNVIDSSDLELVNGLIGKRYGEDGYLINADINADKVINAADAALVSANMGKTSNDYSSNVNVLVMNTEISDSDLLVSGKAAPGSTVNCSTYYSSYSVFDEEKTCDENGNFEFVIELNRTGDYTIEVSADNQAYSVQKSITY